MMFMDQEGATLATEMLKELKTSARRWFIAFIIMIIVEACTVVGFLWYLSLPVDETVSVENDEGNANYIGGDVTGGVYNGENHSAETESGS